MSFKKQAKELLHFLSKKVAYKRDLLKPNKLEQAEALLKELKDLAGVSRPSQAEQTRLGKISREIEGIFPSRPGWDGWAENVEVVFVAVVLALALRTYFLQPFKIPTDSMKPTLWGIYTQPEAAPAPNPLVQVADFFIRGRTWHTVVASERETLQGLNEEKLFGIPFITVTRFVTDRGSHLVWATYDQVLKGAPELLTRRQEGRLTFEPGEVIARFSVATGDHVFVNKFIYHFRKARAGEVFVFTTHDIDYISQGNRASGMDFDQFYIKRCVGAPGDRLQVDPPHLIRNGEIMRANPVFDRIYSLKDGYRGYGLMEPHMAEKGQTVHLGPDQYWAMGDNSYNSSDSRRWGHVPRENLVGTGFIVYWPFTQRWGLIR
ncbi:MAG: signal peptidase I [Candidatus Methylacidiphilales bacterium]|nr:signal peptidase I [Candidatus Methylacidiphilales bacterium]